MYSARMPCSRRVIASLLLLLMVPVGIAAAQSETGDAAPAAAEPLRIGTKVSPPFVVEREDGSLGGLSIELWNVIAEQEDVAFELVQMDLEGIFDGIVAGELDAGIAAISVTPDREARIDFSHAYFTDGLGIAVLAEEGSGGFLRGLRAILTPGFWLAVGSLAFVLLVVGLVAWLAERRRNAEEFGGGILRGIGNGFWFSAVTMTTVGYGDKSPKSPAGRAIALVWMFASIIVISTFTGTIASSITAASLESAVRGPEDLSRAVVGTLGGTASETALRNRGVAPRTFDDLDAGLDALVAGNVEAFVHDTSILTYAIGERHPGRLRVLGARFDLRPYAIAVPEGSPELERLNRALLAATQTAEWRASVQRWVGQ